MTNLKRQAFLTTFVVALVSPYSMAADTVLNERWIGNWKSIDGSTSISISPTTLRQEKTIFKWSKDMNKVKSGCVFGYAGKLSRQDLVGFVDRLKAGLKDQPGIKADPNSRGEISKLVATSDASLKQIGEGNYKLVGSACYPDETGDGEICSGHYILDKESLYEVGMCEPAGPTGFYVKQLQKRQAGQ